MDVFETVNNDFMQPYALPAFTDNYIWAMRQENRLYVVDPGDAEVVKQHAIDQGLTVTGILVTHKHYDHIGGIQALVNCYKCNVYGPNCADIPQVTHKLSAGDKLEIEDYHFQILNLPGHTLEHIGYVGDNGQDKVLFVGDTLFAGGCGRMFEGSYPEYLETLDKLKTLPENTKVYCAHEYTEANLTFACQVEPLNPSLRLRYQAVQAMRKQHQITLPTTIQEEKLTNPYFRVREEAVIECALKKGAASAQPVDVFSTIRQWKDNFHG